MGKAKITSGGPSGLYNIELIKSTARITAQIAAINVRLAVLVKAIPDAQTAKTAAQVVLNTKKAALDDAIGKFILGTFKSDDVNKCNTAFISALDAYSSKEVAYSLLMQEQEAKTKQKALLQKAAVPEARIGIWCADLTETLLPGEEVGTIEVNGESNHILIYPAGEWDDLPEALLQPVLASTSAGVFYNLAVLPGWQKWKPTYRTGVITAIFGDLCTVAIDAAVSSQQRLNINPVPGAFSKSNVPISYMGYNGAAFSTGDEVIVQFTDQDWTKPKVIGFVHDPRARNYPLSDYLVLYQDRKIGRVDNFPDDGIVAHQISFAYDDCDIVWSYRNQKYVVVCAQWVKLVDVTGAVSKTYNLSGTEGSIAWYGWQWNREYFRIRIDAVTFIDLDHDLNYIGRGVIDFASQFHWKETLPWVAPYLAERVESWCYVGSDIYLEIVYKSTDYDRWTGTYHKQSGYWRNHYTLEPYAGNYTAIDGPTPTGVPTPTAWYKFIDPRPDLIGIYEWFWDSKFMPYSSAELRLYNHELKTYKTLYTLPIVDHPYVNDVAFDAYSYTEVTISRDAGTYGQVSEVLNCHFHYDAGQFSATQKTCGNHQTVTYYDPDGGPNPGDYPSPSALFILANSGVIDENDQVLIPPSIKAFDINGNIVVNITPPAISDEKIIINYPQKYPSLSTADNYSGWYGFTQRHSTFALVTNTADTEITSSAQLLADLAAVNTQVNAYSPNPIKEIGDYWEFISVPGSGHDCEDYALEKAKLLLEKGYPASALHIEIGNLRGDSSAYSGHAWLVVQTTAGDVILDNLYAHPMNYSVVKASYVNRARQTGLYWNYVE